MTLQEYIKVANESLDLFEQNWVENNEKDPEAYPMELENEDEWEDQELAVRFGILL